MSDVRPSAAVIGGGPAGLMAAETLCRAGVDTRLYEAKGSVGRKFLLAGKGGLNLTHSEPFDTFVTRFREREPALREWLRDFGADPLREWARGLGVETFVGSSGRVFPADLKAAPLLRGWVRRLRHEGVRFFVQHRCTAIGADRTLHFDTPQGALQTTADVIVLAIGGASWPQLGSDGAWTGWLPPAIDVAPLRPANCGFDVAWREPFRQRCAGAPLKPVVLRFEDAQGHAHERQGEMAISEYGIEGSLVYALSAPLRDTIAAHGALTVSLDLAPGRDASRLARELSRQRPDRSLSERLRRGTGLGRTQLALLRECAAAETLREAQHTAAAIKALPLRLLRPRPVAEAISTAGGVRLEALDERLMAHDWPGLFCAGEMLDWEAPTGGYLLTACFASGHRAGRGAVDFLAKGRS